MHARTLLFPSCPKSTEVAFFTSCGRRRCPDQGCAPWRATSQNAKRNILAMLSRMWTTRCFDRFRVVELLLSVVFFALEGLFFSALWLCTPTLHLALAAIFGTPSSRWPCGYSLMNLFQAPATPPSWGEVSCAVLEITSHPFRNGLIDPEDKNAQDYARHCASDSDPSGSLLAVPNAGGRSLSHLPRISFFFEFERPASCNSSSRVNNESRRLHSNCGVGELHHAQHVTNPSHHSLQAKGRKTRETSEARVPGLHLSRTGKETDLSQGQGMLHLNGNTAHVLPSTMHSQNDRLPNPAHQEHPQ